MLTGAFSPHGHCSTDTSSLSLSTLIAARPSSSHFFVGWSFSSIIVYAFSFIFGWSIGWFFQAFFHLESNYERERERES